MIKLRMTAEVKKQLKQIDKMFLPYQVKYGIRYTGKQFVATLNSCVNIHYDILLKLGEKTNKGYEYDFLSKQLEQYFTHIASNLHRLEKHMTDTQLELLVAPLMAYQPREGLDSFRESFVGMTRVIIEDIPARLLRESDFMGNFCSFATIFSDWWAKGIKAEQVKQVKSGKITELY